MKRLPAEGEKVSSNNATNRVLSWNIQKELIQLSIKERNNPAKKQAENLNRGFSKEDLQVANST